MFLYWIFINQIIAPIKFLNFKRAPQLPSQDSTFRWASRAFFQKIRHFESQIRRLWKLYYLFLKLGHRNSLLLGTGFCFLASDLFAYKKTEIFLCILCLYFLTRTTQREISKLNQQIFPLAITFTGHMLHPPSHYF